MSRTKKIPASLPPAPLPRPAMPPPPPLPAAVLKKISTATAKPPATPRITRKMSPDAPRVTAESVTARLLALPQSRDGRTALWKKDDFHAEFAPVERPLLDAALARLQTERRLVALRHGQDEYFAFADALGLRPGLTAPATANAPAPAAEGLMGVYRRLVRESGGFPDVKIAQLARGIGPAAAHVLPERLVAMWRAGDAVLSLGDWSLASEETRAAALELDGEKYLLVRFVGA